MNHCINIALLLLLYSIYHFPQTLTAASPPNKTGDADKTLPKLHPQTVISVGQPVPGNDKSSISGDGKVEVKPIAAQETCELAKASNRCPDNSINVTACILLAGDAPEALLVVNDGDDSLKFNFTTPPLEPTPDYIELAAHKFKKINLSASISSATSVILKADNWKCVIQLKVPLPPPLPRPPSPPPPPPPAFPSSSYSYAAYAMPVNGVYVLLGTSLLIGLILGCYKLGKFRRHSDKGVPYLQLEMGKNVLSTSSADVEAAGGGGGGGGWDQDWDDDWDEEKAVRTPGGNHVVSNGSTFAESNGWDDDWKDIS